MAGILLKIDCLIIWNRLMFCTYGIQTLMTAMVLPSDQPTSLSNNADKRRPPETPNPHLKTVR
jgi:hypothetical protein